jgi:hypothetical protein
MAVVVFRVGRRVVYACWRGGAALALVLASRRDVAELQVYGGALGDRQLEEQLLP